jgi:hypothetical protein
VQYEWDTLPDARLFVFDPANQQKAVPLTCLDWVAEYADPTAFHLVQPLNASVDNHTLADLAFVDALPQEVRALLHAPGAPQGLCHFACADGYAFATVRGPRTRAWCVLVDPEGTAGDGQCAMYVESGDFVRVQRLVAGARVV